MRKVIAAINMTLDGYCDHTAGIADAELHQHYAELLNDAGILLYGRITYQLMEDFWPAVVETPTGDQAVDAFAQAIDGVPKLVFSHTMKKLAWKSAKLAKRGLAESVSELRQQPGKDIFVGSPGLIASLTNLGLIDEYQLCIHPVILGRGLPLFKNITDKKILNLLRTKAFGSGAVCHYYRLAKS